METADAGADKTKMRAAFRALPSVEQLAGQIDGVPHGVAVRAARQTVDAAREQVLDASPHEPDLVAEARARAAEIMAPSLRGAINATGVILHTNLGRAPLAEAAQAAVARATHGYSNLEYDLATGRRGSRQAHVETLIAELTGAEAAMVVNNCAAAVLLAVAALARGREIVMSRGQMVEIGGSFRIPEVIEHSGARLVEVGTTNRTRLADFEKAITADTGALLRVHPSNFRTLGFVEEVQIEDLCGTGIRVIDDVGSGVLAENIDVLGDEPSVKRSVEAGCAVVCFSGDKLLGGPQAGVMAGRADAIKRCRDHPLARAVRIDKLSLAALEATVRLYLDAAAAVNEIPVLGMLTTTDATLRTRVLALRDSLPDSISAEVIESSAKVGGGALPLLELTGPVCAIDPHPVALEEFAGRLRGAAPPVIARAHEGRLLLDPRTIADHELDDVTSAVIAACE